MPLSRVPPTQTRPSDSLPATGPSHPSATPVYATLTGSDIRRLAATRLNEVQPPILPAGDQRRHRQPTSARLTPSAAVWPQPTQPVTSSRRRLSVQPSHAHHSVAQLPIIPPRLQATSTRSRRSCSPPPGTLVPPPNPQREPLTRPPSSRSRYSMPPLLPTTNYLAAKLEVDFSGDAKVDMVGNPQTGTSYSLPGYVLITIPDLPLPLAGRTREVRQLTVVMEGKSEFFDEQGRYTPMRIYSDVVHLATPDRLLLLRATEPPRPKSGPLQIAVPFDLRVPGWLPATHLATNTNTAYGVRVWATFGWAEGSSSSLNDSSSASSAHTSMHPDVAAIGGPSLYQPSAKTSRAKHHLSFFFSNPSSQARATEEATSKFHPFVVRRHQMSLADNVDPERGSRYFELQHSEGTISPIDVGVLIPDWVDVDGPERGLKVTLKVRARRGHVLAPMQRDFICQIPPFRRRTAANCAEALRANSPPDTPKRPGYNGADGAKGDIVHTHLLELGMEVEEVERANSIPSHSFLSTYPIPADQPSPRSTVHQLVSPRSPYAELCSRVSTEEPPFQARRSRRCLLAPDGSQRAFYFEEGGLALGPQNIKKINVVIPMPAPDSPRPGNLPQADIESPFHRIKHLLKLRLVCRNVHATDNSEITLTTPIRFSTCSTTLSSSSTGAAVPQLPAYIQLFHENGDARQCDPLPLYSRVNETSTGLLGNDTSTALPQGPAPEYISDQSRWPTSTASPVTRSPIAADQAVSSAPRLNLASMIRSYHPGRPISNPAALTQSSSLGSAAIPGTRLNLTRTIPLDQTAVIPPALTRSAPLTLPALPPTSPLDVMSMIYPDYPHVASSTRAMVTENVARTSSSDLAASPPETPDLVTQPLKQELGSPAVLTRRKRGEGEMVVSARAPPNTPIGNRRVRSN